MAAVLSKEAIAHYQRGEFAQADQACVALLSAEPANAAGWHMRGILALQARKPVEAVQFISRAIELEPNDNEMCVNLGSALLALGRATEAAAVLERAIALEPACAEAHLGLGRCRLMLGETAEAGAAAERALALRPEWAEALELMAAIAVRSGAHDRALALAEKILQKEPGRSDAHRVIGDVLTRRGEPLVALDHYRTALRFGPTNSVAYENYALTLSRLGRHREAIEAYQKALGLKPDQASASAGLALELLMVGRLREGWAHYVSRPRADTATLAQRFCAPWLDRLPMAKECVLAWTDQGVGEHILFASLVPDLIATGADLSVECDPRLVALFRRSFPGVGVVANNDEFPTLPSLDGHFALADTARWLRDDFAAFPHRAGYLKADVGLTARLRERYRVGHANHRLVGISWQTTRSAKMSARKSIPLEQWAPVLRVPGVTFVSLQYGDCAADIAAVAAQLGVEVVHDTTIDSLVDFDPFAAQVSAMDLVITTSNATAHLAGALNVPTWTFVPIGFGGIWHWFLDRDDSPWYPVMRLMRQQSIGEWDGAVQKAANRLADGVAALTAGLRA